MPTPQIIIFLNISGDPRAELPGMNGHRQAIPLPADFADRNPEIIAALRGEANRLAERDEKLRIAADEIRKREKLDRDVEWWDGLPPNRRAEIELKAKKEVDAAERVHDAELARARRVWTYIALNHDVALANRVIPDVKRRPRNSIARSLLSDL